MQRVAYPYTMLMIMKVSFHYFLLSFSLLFLFYIYLDSSLSEAVEYDVPCSCGEGTRVNNVSDKKKVFAWYSRMCHCLFPADRAKCLFHWDGADCSAFYVELTASRRAELTATATALCLALTDTMGAELTATALCLALTDTMGAELTATALCLALTDTKGAELTATAFCSCIGVLELTALASAFLSFISTSNQASKRYLDETKNQ